MKKIPPGTKVIIKDPITRTPVDGVVVREYYGPFVDVEYAYNPKDEDQKGRNLVSGKPFKAITMIRKEKLFIPPR